MEGTIADTPAWKALESHAESIQALHLRDLLKDQDRCGAMRMVAEDVFFDYSRQNATLETKVVTQLHSHCPPLPFIHGMIAPIS